MGNEVSKVERLGLGKKVRALWVAGVRSGREIARRVEEETGRKVHQATINRWLKPIRGEATQQARETVAEHVDREVSKDLRELEELQGQCLAWSREAGRDTVERAAEAAARIEGKLAEWLTRLGGAKDEGERRSLARWMIREALSYAQLDNRRQEQRLAAILALVKIVELKLRQAGALQDEKGHIYLVDHRGRLLDGEGQPLRNADGSARMVVVPGGVGAAGGG
jgi:hypothetical protein